MWGGVETPLIKTKKNMRKLLYTLAGLSALALMASCNKEAERAASPEGEVVTATFTVAAPEGVATKAISDGTTATNLIVAVYDETDKYLDDLSTHATISGGTPTWNVSMKVVKDMTYRFVFIAKSASDNGFSTFTPATGKLAIDYSKLSANNDNADFFFVQDKFTVENSFSKTEEMHRPLAQVNFGASDLAAAAYSINTETMLTGVKLTGIHSEMSVFTGNVTSTAADVTFAQALRVDEGATEFAPNNKRIAMVYALVATDQANVTATLNVTAKGAKNDDNHIITREIANVPLKRNYRTNILGNIFTNDFNFTVNTVPGFYTSDSNKLIGPSFASVADLNAYFATFTDNADNGDVNPEVVTLTAIEGTPGSIVLPDYAGRVQIRITASYGETLTLAYPDGATNKPAIVEIYAPSLSALSGDITSTHVTILGGSVINTTSLHTSDSTLEIQEGATVSTVNILKGNARIAGTVAKVDVQSGATADGENPVQVFVAKEAAIKQIELNAKSDVVVEQPKDHIDVEATEKKIAVYVKEGADNSTATAQNGGVIYVQASVPCTVTADGTSVAEDGSSVSSTVIIDSGAAGSTVTAENGGAINLTANGNCEVTASGSSTPEDPTETPVPSSVVIDKVDTGVEVNTETEGDATVEPAPDAEIDGDINAYVAQNKTTEVKYTSLEAAFAEAEANDEILVMDNCTVEANIPVNFPVTLNVNGFTITNNVTGNRLFRIGGETLFEIKGNKGKFVIPETNKNSYGFVDLQNQSNEASYYAGLKASNVEFIGATTGGSFFKARTHYQQFLFENVNVDCTDGDGQIYGGYANGLNASIINCYDCQICTVSIKGGTFKYASRGANYGVFQDYLNAFTTLEDVTVISSDGPVNQGMSYSCLIKNCDFANPNNVSAWAWTNTAICASNNKTIEVDGGSYEGNYACYVYTSGGTIHIKGGTFTGRSAVLIAQVDNNSYASASSNIIVDDGTFNGPIKMDQGANCSITIKGGHFSAEAGQLFGPIYGTLSITGGTFSQDPSAYVAEGYGARKIGESTWEVVEGTFLTFTEFNEQLLEAGGVYDGTGKKVFVILSASERSTRNNNTAQFYLGRGTGEKINGIPSVSVKHVTFTYNHDADDHNAVYGTTPLNTGEVYATAMDISFEDCTFTDNTSLSSWGYLESTVNPPQSMVVKNCTFSDLSGRYAIHQNRAKEFTVEGCTFTNCQRGIHTNSPAPESVVVKNNTFSGISDDYGVLCLAEGMGNMSEKTVEVTGNIATGQAFLRLLCTLNLTQYNAIKDNNTYETLHCTQSKQELIPTE